MEIIIWGIVIAFVVGGLWWMAEKGKQEREDAAALVRIKRRQRLIEKYGPQRGAELADGVIAQGMTEEMVIDALGQPLDVDEKVLKTKTKRTLKYNQLTARTYGVKVFLDDGVVVGWDNR